jgi:hypothetical protein
MSHGFSALDYTTTTMRDSFVTVPVEEPRKHLGRGEIGDALFSHGKTGVRAKMETETTSATDYKDHGTLRTIIDQSKKRKEKKKKKKKEKVGNGLQIDFCV